MKSTDSGALRHLWASPWTAWVGARYLRSKKSSKFLSFITVLSMLGVGLGVTAMIVVLSVMDGFEDQLKSRLMGAEMHVLVSPTRDLPGFDRGYVPEATMAGSAAERFLKTDPRVESYWPVVSAEAILRTGRQVTGVVLKGVTEGRREKLQGQIVEKAEPRLLVEHVDGQEIRRPGISIGQELAFMMRLIPGDLVTMISPTETEGPLSAVPRMKRFVVESVYRTGIPEQELHTVFVDADDVRSFLRKRGALSQWEVAVKEFDDAPEVAAELRSAAPGFRVKDWIQLNANLFASLRLERIAMFVILAFIVIVASFNIVTTLSLMVLEKKKEIAILKAMGARNGQVAAIFLSEGLFIGLVGAGGGAVLAFVLSAILKRYEFIELPDVYYDRTLPVTFEPLYYLAVGVCAFLIVIAACLYPSRRAAALNPLDGIRQ